MKAGRLICSWQMDSSKNNKSTKIGPLASKSTGVSQGREEVLRMLSVCSISNSVVSTRSVLFCFVMLIVEI